MGSSSEDGDGLSHAETYEETWEPSSIARAFADGCALFEGFGPRTIVGSCGIVLVGWSEVEHAVTRCSHLVPKGAHVRPKRLLRCPRHSSTEVNRMTMK